MSTRLPFVCLPANEQARARAMFFDARNSDGYLYELDRDGRVLCRHRSTSDWIDGEPPESIDVAWLRVLTNPAFDESDVHVVLGVLDSDGVWYESGDYKGESTMDAVLPGTITHWMPYAVPRARISA
jgi:hypothetical protein